MCLHSVYYHCHSSQLSIIVKQHMLWCTVTVDDKCLSKCLFIHMELLHKLHQKVMMVVLWFRVVIVLTLSGIFVFSYYL